jgi:hypothetical protein
MGMIRLAPLVVVVALAGCGKNNEPPPPTTGSPTAKPESGPSHSRHPSAGVQSGGMAPDEEARRRYGMLCANCHGTDGTANTPSAQILNPKPRDYTDPAWQEAVTDDELRLAILKGGKAVGKSEQMPGNPDLADKPEVIEGLVKIVRGFRRKD